MHHDVYLYFMMNPDAGSGAGSEGQASSRQASHHEVSERATAPAAVHSSPPALAKFSTQLEPLLLAELKTIARSEGRLLQAVLDEALRDYVDRRRTDGPRRHVMLALAQSLAEFDRLYRELSK